MPLPMAAPFEESVAPELVEKLCLDEDQLAQLSMLAETCERVFGGARDIEWAFAGGKAVPASVPSCDTGGFDAADRQRSRPRTGRSR